MSNWSTYTAVVGGSLVGAEVILVIAYAFFQKPIQKHYPRVAAQLGIAMKTTSWRATAGIDTFLISYLVTGKLTSAGAVVGTEILTKFFLFYAHEWVWNRPMLAKFLGMSKAPVAH